MSTEKEEIKAHRAQLEELSEKALEGVLDRTRKHRDRIVKKREAAELCRVLARRRALKVAGGALSGVRLDLRIERLFEQMREGEEKPPMSDLLSVFDGIAARILMRRLWLFGIGLFTIIPAVASVALLAGQNRDMIEQNQVEEESGYREARTLYTEILHGTTPQQQMVDGAPQVVTLPRSHRRLRAEAFESLVALEKQRWSVEERKAMPPTRFVDLRNADLSNLALGGRIGLLDRKQRSDFSRVWLEGADLRGTKILQSETAGSVFRNALAQGALFSCGSSVDADFSGINATGAQFLIDASEGEPLNLQGAKFDGAILRDALFEEAVLLGVSFENADLSGVRFVGCLISDCDLRNANLGQEMDFSDTVIIRCVVTDAQMEAIRLAPYCFDEPGEDPGTRLITLDQEKHSEWLERHMAELDALAEEELEELRKRNERREERKEENR